MIFAQIGLGSMGKRRIRNLLHHKVRSQSIIGFDLNSKRCEETQSLYGTQCFKSWEMLLSKANPDVFIISTPPNAHAQYFLEAAKRNKHFFVEISTTDEGYEELLRFLKSNASFVAAPSCTYQFYEPIKRMKTIIDKGLLGKVHFFAHHMGQYLPDWHPYEDYRNFYGAREQGALYEMLVFELQWLSWIIGDQSVSGALSKNKVSDLEIKGPDLTIINLKTYHQAIGNIVLDLLTKPLIRHLRITGSKGTLIWDWHSHQLTLYNQIDQGGKSIQLPKENPYKGYLADETMYQQEIEVFLKAIKGAAHFPYTFAQDHKHLAFINKLTKEKEIE